MCCLVARILQRRAAGQDGQLRSQQTMGPQLALGRQWKPVQRIATRSKLPHRDQVHTCLPRRAAGRAGRVSAEQAGPVNLGKSGQLPGRFHRHPPEPDFPVLSFPEALDT